MLPASLIELGFPLGIRLTHAFNIVFLTLLIRSGIEILGGHPMLYFNDGCRPGSEWIRFTSKRMLRHRRWTAEDEKQPYTPWLALPAAGCHGRSASQRPAATPPGVPQPRRAWLQRLAL